MNVNRPFLIQIGLCAVMLLFVCGGVANAQDVPPDNVPAEDVVPELTPDEEVPWEDVIKKKNPEGVTQDEVAPEKAIVDEDYIVPNEHKMAVMLIAGTAGNSQITASGFACKFKNRECIATNLHVIEDLSAITVTTLSGSPIALSDQMFLAEDADICLLAIKGSFAELGIVPLEFMQDVLKDSKSGDEVICLGGSPGDDVATVTKGRIKTRGQSSVGTDAPTVQGNSGGPIIHRDSGKVIGLVTRAMANDANTDPLADAAVVSDDSTAGDMSCFGHRLDAVKKWRSITFAEFRKSSSVIANARSNLDNIYGFLTDKPGWRNDRSLASAWDAYEKFLDGSDGDNTKEKDAKNSKEKDGENTKEKDGENTKETDDKPSKEIAVLGEADEFASFSARISRMKAKGVSQGDYDKARLSVIKALDWKIQAVQDVIKKSTPIGPRQIRAVNELKSDSQKLADAIKRL